VNDDLARLIEPLDCGEPISKDALQALVGHVADTYGTTLPEDYIAFLRLANGADGDTASGLPVVLWQADLLPGINEDTETEQWLPGLFIIGSDAGDLHYGIDMRPDAPAERYIAIEGLYWPDVLWRCPSLVDLVLYLDRPRGLVSRARGLVLLLRQRLRKGRRTTPGGQ
jgi:hypothetical protein